jgi:hypothetical protein
MNQETNYDYWQPKLYAYDGKQQVGFVKVRFKGTSQVARVEIWYTTVNER